MSWDITFTCRGCSRLLPQSYEDEDGLCYLCTPLSNEEWEMVYEAQRGAQVGETRHKFRKGKVSVSFGPNIYTPPTSTLEVDALICGDLAVHKKHYHPDTAWLFEKEPTRWSITHVPSGFAVHPGFKRQAHARRFAEAIADLDWSGDAQTVAQRNKATVERLWRDYKNGELAKELGGE